jgi:hypothetical protein
MSTTTTEFATYCNQAVQVLEVESTEYGNEALIQYDDGREEWVPLVRLDFLD